MSGLAYRQDMDEVRRRLTAWWRGGDIGRPAMQIHAPRAAPAENVEAVAQPAGWQTDYSTSDFAYREDLAARACVDRHYLAEAVPAVSPDLAPNCLALFLGCHGVEMPGTVWCRPCIDRPEDARFAFEPKNFYWDFCLQLGCRCLELGRGRFLLAFPDLIEGLDTLAAMRGTETLLLDLVERPAWVHDCLRRITDLYFQYYDVLYALFRDEVGGSVFWAWAPGRMAKFQCDFSAMISPGMFGEFMAPVLREMCRRVDHCMYHWDGPGAIAHHDHLLAIDELDMIQWTPGAGAEPPYHRRWWPLHHRTIEAGKKVFVSCPGMEELLAMKREFGQGLKQFLLQGRVGSVQEGEELIRAAQV